jgi:hypothetical protein
MRFSISFTSGTFFKPSRLIYQVYHMLFMVCNSILCYPCHTPDMSQRLPYVCRETPKKRFSISLQPEPSRMYRECDCRGYDEHTESESSHACMHGKQNRQALPAVILVSQIESELSSVWAESSVSLDGDPQAGYPAIPVLTGNRSRLSVYISHLSRLSQAR